MLHISMSSHPFFPHLVRVESLAVPAISFFLIDITMNFSITFNDKSPHNRIHLFIT